MEDGAGTQTLVFSKKTTKTKCSALIGWCINSGVLLLVVFFIQVSMSGEAWVARWKMELEQKPWYFGGNNNKNKCCALIGWCIEPAVLLLVSFY